MIALIEDAMTDIQDPKKTLAEYILDKIEEAGMLPPLNRDALYFDGDKANPKSVIYRTWEKEILNTTTKNKAKRYCAPADYNYVSNTYKNKPWTIECHIPAGIVCISFGAKSFLFKIKESNNE